MARIIVSAVTIFLYIGGGSFLGAIFLLRRYGDKPDLMTIVVCLVLGLLAAVRDVRANMNMPPIDNAALDTLNQLKQLMENNKK